MGIGAGTAYLIGSLISAGAAAGSAHVTIQEGKKAEASAKLRGEEQLRQQKLLASKVTAPRAKIGGNVELLSAEAKEDEEIKSRSSRSRLRVKRKAGASTVGTGLKVG